MPKIIHYRNDCIGCGICYEQQPELWRMSRKDGKASLLNAVEKKNIFILPITSGIKDASMSIAAQCPVKIIKVQ